MISIAFVHTTDFYCFCGSSLLKCALCLKIRGVFINLLFLQSFSFDMSCLQKLVYTHQTIILEYINSTGHSWGMTGSVIVTNSNWYLKCIYKLTYTRDITTLFLDVLMSLVIHVDFKTDFGSYCKINNNLPKQLIPKSNLVTNTNSGLQAASFIDSMHHWNVW
jgi:hypothetical protein